MMKHRLVVIGDSLSQGFMSGAIHRTDISNPVMVAEALGVRESFVVPDFHGEGGLPVNLERILNEMGKHYGREISWWEFVPMAVRLRGILDRVEDYWERGKGARPYPQRAICNNLSVWGFEVRDAYTVSEGSCRRILPEPTDHLLPGSAPEPQILALYETLRLFLPVAPDRVSAIGYRGSGANALPLEPFGTLANPGILVRLKNMIFGGGSDQPVRYSLVEGGAGPQTGGVDIGAPTGTNVYAPVDGTILAINPVVISGRRFGHRVET